MVVVDYFVDNSDYIVVDYFYFVEYFTFNHSFVCDVYLREPPARVLT